MIERASRATGTFDHGNQLDDQGRILKIIKVTIAGIYTLTLSSMAAAT
jgi:hypothetical protein